LSKIGLYVVVMAMYSLTTHFVKFYTHKTNKTNKTLTLVTYLYAYDYYRYK